MTAQKVDFDVIGQSYYPKWHGTIPDLQANLAQLAKRYKQDLVVVEYSERKREVNDAVFTLPGGKGKGSFIWEPLNTWEAVFDKEGRANELLPLYDEISQKYKVQ
jgi:arabinogalactan endo-1,4-beta-galactosidase